MNTYKARYWREGDVWEVELVDEPGVHTFASTLGRARRYIREATAAWYDLDLAEVDIVDDVDLPGGLESRVRAVLGLRAEVERNAAQVGEDTAAVIGELLQAGLSVRDAGEIMHLSPQRVSQLARS